MSTKRNTTHRGFSLIEVIITITMFTVLSLAVTSAIVQFYRSNTHALIQSNELQSISRSLKVMVRETREAIYGDNGAFPVAVANEHTFSFYTDDDQDGSAELVSYELSGTTLVRETTDSSGTPPSYSGTPNASSTISFYVRNIAEDVPTFRYFDDEGTEFDGSDITAIAVVEFSVIVDLDTSADPDAFTLETSVSLRNLKDNL